MDAPLPTVLSGERIHDLQPAPALAVERRTARPAREDTFPASSDTIVDASWTSSSALPSAAITPR
ncbi:hypothetical protein [Actinomadura gamaensis]|uniref:Uncharacterized protein n=1 Tax=Actinomadura gamaensis TaxID=1763541 RepID=A0ABV9UEG6_9ACTN